MADEQQTTIDSTVAGVTTPTPTSNGSGSQTEDWEGRYKGASKKMDEFQKDATKYKARVTELMAEIEGLRSEKNNAVTDWQTKHQTLEQQAAEQSKKLAQYELKEKTRKLIYSDDFKDLATDFEMDDVFQYGVLAAAKELDDAALKASLAKSLEVRKGKLAAAATAAVTGASSASPNTGTSGAGATEEQLAEQIRAERDPAKRSSLFEKLAQLRDRNS